MELFQKGAMSVINEDSEPVEDPDVIATIVGEKGPLNGKDHSVGCQCESSHITLTSIFLNLLFWLIKRKEGNILFNDALNTFYLRLYGVRHMVKDHSDNERGNPLPPHRLLFLISSNGSFICIIPQTG